MSQPQSQTPGNEFESNAISNVGSSAGSNAGGNVASGLASNARNNTVASPAITPAPANLATRVLVVDDEPQMLSIVTFALETAGFECLSAKNGAEAWQLVNSEQIDLIILDLMLPDTSGITLCERIRASHTTPIILLTALGEERDRVSGFHAGADDYVTKPFSPRELVLRASAIARRSKEAWQHVDWLQNGGLRLNPESGEAQYCNSRIALTNVEARLLASLMRRSGSVVQTRVLLNEVWNTASLHGGREMVKTTVYRLRRKLQEAGVTQPDFLKAERGTGYCLAQLD